MDEGSEAMTATMGSRARRAVGLVAAAGLLVFAAGGCVEATTSSNDAASSGISVTGTGSVAVVPDVGVLSIGVEVTAETVGEARADAARTMEAIGEALRASGVDDGDVATRSFNIYPQYQYEEGKAPTITGFTVNNQVTVKVRDIDRLPSTLDDAIAAGGDFVRVNNVSFAVDEPERFFAEAREKAVADAGERAAQLAALAGVELGDPLVITESTGGAPSPFPAAFADSARVSATPLQPGEEEITIAVSVTYAIR